MMQQTPVHDNHNPDLLRMIPPTAQRIIEIGCSSGALAREFKKINPECYYVGVEIDSNYAKMAKRYCDETMVINIDDANEEFFKAHSDKLRWFTRKTILSLFNDNGFEIKELQPRVFNEGNRQKFLDGLTHLVGLNFMVRNPKALETELCALQYVSFASKKP